MSRTATLRKYGKSTRKTRAELLFAELPRSPIKKESESNPDPEPEPGAAPVDEVAGIVGQLASIALENTTAIVEEVGIQIAERSPSPVVGPANNESETTLHQQPEDQPSEHGHLDEQSFNDGDSSFDGLRTLTWSDVCLPGDRIEKIAEASYAEVYRITNEHGTSIIKTVRLESPIKPQTKAQERSGLVDEEPHSEEDMLGELRISEWLADIPGFVVYKEQYVVRGKAPKALLETHQAFHRRMKRKDPDRLQFYPSPSRYLDETRFLVVELGDAGIALEDFELTSISQVWDIFLHTALALARAEDLIEFEHRDLHEGNLCIRRVRPPTTKPFSSPPSPLQFGFSGLDITILDYGLSRAADPSSRASSTPSIVAYDLEKDLALFTSTHAPLQTNTYRAMRSFLINADRVPLLLDPKHHTVPYPPCRSTSSATSSASSSSGGTPISWREHHPYTNVLWLAYLYNYLIRHFKGDRKELAQFKKETAELRMHLDPAAPRRVLSFPCAGGVVRFAVEAGWVGEGQLVDMDGGSLLEGGSWLGGMEGQGDVDGAGGEEGGGDRGER
ncbi:Serine/threonine-protein kinase haspin hrk1 [Madurella mycetomatis]|uniref:non-specific serine/threonine protein kinase n=1 Tax=Madurella mycetomatis TaxID=100816 RepID=A0A175W6X8_9PEZI|nr:Serine/threonine-protein kinase haspin hrk1 [Madurella mycetomatis]